MSKQSFEIREQNPVGWNGEFTVVLEPAKPLKKRNNWKYGIMMMTFIFSAVGIFGIQLFIYIFGSIILWASVFPDVTDLQGITLVILSFVLGITLSIELTVRLIYLTGYIASHSTVRPIKRFGRTMYGATGAPQRYDLFDAYLSQSILPEWLNDKVDNFLRDKFNGHHYI